MTAPEDQNGLREALARADQDDIVGLLGEVAQAMVNRGLHPAAGPVRRAARYITALRTELDADRASLRAAEAEITRLKEGMEAAAVRFEDIAAGRAFQPRLHAATGATEARAVLIPKEPTHG